MPSASDRSLSLRLFLLALKCCPFVMAAVSAAGFIACWRTAPLRLAGTAVPTLFIALASKAFRYCFWHRLLLYYALALDVCTAFFPRAACGIRPLVLYAAAIGSYVLLSAMTVIEYRGKKRKREFR